MLSKEMKKKLLSFVREDIGRGDITSRLVERKKCRAVITLNGKAVVSGLEEATFLFKHFKAKTKTLALEGRLLQKGTKVMQLEGFNREILKVERTALNILSRMGGVSTACFKAKALLPKGSRTRIALTRKTMPGLNAFDKKAAVIAGIEPHRVNLNEMVLLKENHLCFFEGIGEAIRNAKKRTPRGKRIEIEVRTLKEAVEAAKEGPDVIMLDNFSVRKAKKAIALIRKKSNALIEVSGGITPKNLKSFAVLKPDLISMGALTANAKGIDFSLDVKVK